jgi:hypothetical protein
MENLSQRTAAATDLQLQRLALHFPAALVLFLIFPFGRVAGSWLGLNIVPPHVFATFAVGPQVLAGNAASVATDTFIEVENR